MSFLSGGYNLLQFSDLLGLVLNVFWTISWTLVRGCRFATSWCNLGLTFGLAVVTLTYNILSGLISETVRCTKLILGRDIDWALKVCSVMV